MNDNQHKQNKHARVYEILRERILSGAYSASHRLVIDALARELGVSKVPIREAIRRLEAEGWVIYQHNTGFQVAPTAPEKWEADMAVLALLEGHATALAAAHLSPEDRSQLWHLNTEMQQALQAVDILTFSRLNRMFHFVIYKRCPNSRLVELIQQEWDRLDMVRSTIFLYVPHRGWNSTQEHDQLIRLIEQGAPFEEIERTAREHKQRTLEAYQSHKDRLALPVGFLE